MNYHLIYQDTKKPSFLDQVRQTIKTKQYNIRTEESYVGWIKKGNINNYLYPINLVV